MTEYRNKTITVKALKAIAVISLTAFILETTDLIMKTDTSILSAILALATFLISAFVVFSLSPRSSRKTKSKKDGRPSIFLPFAHFNQRASHLISQAKRYSNSFSIICIGFDGLDNMPGIRKADAFKGIEYSLDSVLRESDFLTSDQSGKIYACLPMTTEKWDLVSVAEKIINSLNNYFYIASFSANVKSNLGISVYPVTAKDFDSLIISAEKAMTESKSKGGNTYLIHE